MQRDLTVGELAELVGVHKNTVRNYCAKGLITPLRDRNNWRRFTVTEALRFKELLAERRPDGGNNE